MPQRNSTCAVPKLIRASQTFPHRPLPDVGAAVRRELSVKQIGSELAKGARVAIGAGSRGIAGLPEAVRATVAHFESLGAKPFIVPAMGSHGGGTAEGQRKLLAQLGVSEEAIGCPVVSSIETVKLGRTAEGIDTVLDRCAFESDGIFLVNRVKWHTTFEAPLQSGVVKMAAIGLGKVAGATEYHRAAVRLGLGEVVRSVGRHVLASGKVIGGLALVEDAHHAIGKVAAERAPGLEAQDKELLQLAQSWMARLPSDEIDLLIIDEIGKQYSGTGMDSKIVNRHPYGGANPWPWAPRVTRIYVRELSACSYGNAVGIGMADAISERLYQQIDWQVTLVNARAASNLTAVRTPIRAANDREALDLLLATVGRRAACEATLVWIRNTLELEDIIVSENLFAGLGTDKTTVEPVGEGFQAAFDSEQNLIRA